MVPIKDDFYKKYPAFTGQVNDFSDPIDDAEDDEVMARNVRKEVDEMRRAQLITEILEDAEKMATELPTDWRPLSKYVNRSFSDEAAAKKWLTQIVGVWRNELAKLRADDQFA